jgi:hypothetical protein
MADIGRATVVLDAIAESRGPLTLTELAARTRLPRSTVHRIIQALERQLYVVKVPDRHGYALGPGLLKFGMNAHLRLLSSNRSQLAGLARDLNENVELAIFSGREVVVVDQLASPGRLRGVTKVGKSFSLHASCIGMVLLAQLPDPQVAELLQPPLRGSPLKQSLIRHESWPASKESASPILRSILKNMTSEYAPLQPVSAGRPAPCRLYRWLCPPTDSQPNVRGQSRACNGLTQRWQGRWWNATSSRLGACMPIGMNNRCEEAVPCAGIAPPPHNVLLNPATPPRLCSTPPTFCFVPLGKRRPRPHREHARRGRRRTAP